MELRAQFVSDFPPDNILNIEIDNYVEGKRLADADEPNRKTFCYRLEFGLPGFGNIGGVNATKFGIYYSPKDKKYVYNEDKFSSAEEAYKEILNQINMLLQSENNLQKIMIGKNCLMYTKELMELKALLNQKY